MSITLFCLNKSNRAKSVTESFEHGFLINTDTDLKADWSKNSHLFLQWKVMPCDLLFIFFCNSKEEEKDLWRTDNLLIIFLINHLIIWFESYCVLSNMLSLPGSQCDAKRHVLYHCMKSVTMGKHQKVHIYEWTQVYFIDKTLLWHHIHFSIYLHWIRLLFFWYRHFTVRFPYGCPSSWVSTESVSAYVIKQV